MQGNNDRQGETAGKHPRQLSFIKPIDRSERTLCQFFTKGPRCVTVMGPINGHKWKEGKREKIIGKIKRERERERERESINSSQTQKVKVEKEKKEKRIDTDKPEPLL